MNTVLRSIVAVVIGLFVGGVINNGLVSLGMNIVPLPDGAIPIDMEMTPEKMRAAMSHYQWTNFIFPFLAHALGTLIGAYTAVRISLDHKKICALIVASIFFIGGCLMVYLVGGPWWFITMDLLLAYFPMAYLALFLAPNWTSR